MFAALALAAALGAEGYDPLKLGPPAPAALDLTVKDGKRNREIPVRVFLPATGTNHPVVLFSHGLGGNREGSNFFGKHWAARGYAVVFVQHPGSDDSVWKGGKLGQRYAALKQAASGQNFLLRTGDIPAVLDQLAKWNETPGHALHGRLDTKTAGMSGHSFGAVTTQAVSGQAALGKSHAEPRIKAAIPMSPSVPALGGAERAFGAVKIPWLLMTGTKDGSPIGNLTPEQRLQVFPALPPGGKYQVVFHDAEHSAFTERALPGEGGKRNPNHHRAMLALSTAFWDACLRHDSAAQAWLDGDGPRNVLEAKDSWQRK